MGSKVKKCKRACRLDKYPGTKTKMVARKYKQGMSREPVQQVILDRHVKVRCEDCHRVTWIPESELPGKPQNGKVAETFDSVERDLEATKTNG